MAEPHIQTISMNAVEVETSSHLGPIVVGCLAFFILAQGLVYIIKPEMTGRSVSAGKKKIRITGGIIVLCSFLLFYFAYSLTDN